MIGSQPPVGCGTDCVRSKQQASMPERAFFKLLVKEGHEQEYIDRHKAVWPEVQADLQGASARASQPDESICSALLHCLLPLLLPLPPG